jgi:hypothetical protein
MYIATHASLPYVIIRVACLSVITEIIRGLTYECFIQYANMKFLIKLNGKMVAHWKQNTDLDSSL